jgi:hypothetical protein
MLTTQPQSSMTGSVKIYLTKLWCESVNCIQQAQKGIQWSHGNCDGFSDPISEEFFTT